MEKALKKYTKIYRAALQANNFSDIDVRVKAYKERLQEMYISQAFMQHNVYPTMDVEKVYAVIAMYLELKKEDLSDKAIIDIVNSGFDSAVNAKITRNCVDNRIGFIKAMLE
ncbi:MAG: hypothetical protein IJZ16_02395 [Clostridia bacterium]|nr:hypothetical protein [Clostridia bacterium]